MENREDQMKDLTMIEGENKLTARNIKTVQAARTAFIEPSS